MVAANESFAVGDATPAASQLGAETMEAGKEAAPGADMGSGLETADGAQIAPIMEEIFVDDIAMFHVRPDSEELLRRMLAAQELKPHKAVANSVLEEEGLEAIVVHASRKEIETVLAKVNKENEEAILEVNRDTDPDNLHRRLLAAMELSPAGRNPAYGAFGGGAGAGFGGGRARTGPALPSAKAMSIAPKVVRSESAGAQESVADLEKPAAPAAQKIAGKDLDKSKTQTERRMAKSAKGKPSVTRAKAAAAPAAPSASALADSKGNSLNERAGLPQKIARNERANEKQPLVRVIFVFGKSDLKKAKVVDPCLDDA